MHKVANSIIELLCTFERNPFVSLLLQLSMSLGLGQGQNFSINGSILQIKPSQRLAAKVRGVVI